MADEMSSKLEDSSESWAEVTAVVLCMTPADEPYIRRAIRAILEQTTPVRVLVMLNEDLKFVEDLEKDFYGLAAFSKSKIMRPGRARNEAMSFVSTPWVAFCDADDVWLPSKIEVQLRVAKSHSADLVGTCCFLTGDDLGRFGVTVSRHIAVPSTWLIRSEVMRSYPFEPDSLPEDGPWWISTEGKIKKIRLGIPLIEYCVRAGSLSNSMLGKQTKNRLLKIANRSWLFRMMLLAALSIVVFMMRPLKSFRPHPDWQVNHGRA